MKNIRWTELLISVIAAELTGAVSALLSGNFRDTYASLAQPPLSPPAAVFPVVWTILYALMGISAYIVWQSSNSNITAKKLYIAQLAVNFSWSIIFFRFSAFGIAAFTAVLLFALVAAMAVSFSRISQLAAKLNVPYIIWSAYAAYLAVGTFILNR